MTVCAVAGVTISRPTLLPSLAIARCSGAAMWNVSSACRKKWFTAASNKTLNQGIGEQWLVSLKTASRSKNHDDLDFFDIVISTSIFDLKPKIGVIYARSKH